MKKLLFSLLLLTAWQCLADGPIIPSTDYTRGFMRTTNPASAAAYLGVLNTNVSLNIVTNIANSIASSATSAAASNAAAGGNLVTMSSSNTVYFFGSNNVVSTVWTPGAVPIVDRPPCGYSGWYGGITLNTEKDVLTLFTNMVRTGAAQNGFNWFLWDVAGSIAPIGSQGDTVFPLETNAVPYPGLTNMNAQGWMDAYPPNYPDGLQYIIGVAHSMGIKVILYTYNGYKGNVQTTQGTNVIAFSQPGIFGTQYYLSWLSNAICVWGLDGIKDEGSGSIYTNAVTQEAVILNCVRKTGRPFYVNVATPFGYQGWYHGLFNSWRIGVGMFGDVTDLSLYYNWLNNTPYWASAPGQFNDQDEMHGMHLYFLGAGLNIDAKNLLMKNQLALNTLGNSPILFQFVDNPNKLRNIPLQFGQFYAPWDNPNIHNTIGDFKNHMTVLSSNANMVVFDKELSADTCSKLNLPAGTHSIAVQNQSFTSSGSATVQITNIYPNLYPPVCTVHDCFTNAPQLLATNNFTVTLVTNDVQWFNLVPGVEQVFPPGTNWLTYFPWTTLSVAYIGAPIQVNQYGNIVGYPWTDANSVVHQTLFFFGGGAGAVTNTLDWLVNGNGTTFSATFQNQNDALGGQVAVYSVLGDGVVLWTAAIANNVATNMSVNIAGVNDLRISMASTNDFATGIGDPLIYCATQTKTDTSGKVQTLLNDPSKVQGYTFNGNGGGLTNVTAAGLITNNFPLIYAPTNNAGLSLFNGPGFVLSNTVPWVNNTGQRLYCLLKFSAPGNASPGGMMISNKTTGFIESRSEFNNSFNIATTNTVSCLISPGDSIVPYAVGGSIIVTNFFKGL